MSFIEMPGLGEAKEQIAAPEGQYDLCIVSAKMHEKEGKNSIAMVLEIEGEPDYANVFHYIALPNSDDDEAKLKSKNLFAQRFFVQFGVPTDNGVELEQLVGCRATACKLTQDEYEGNVSSKLQVNRLPAEAA
jgi:hypothetical protein